MVEQQTNLISYPFLTMEQVSGHAAPTVLLGALPRPPLHEALALARGHAGRPSLPADREVDLAAHDTTRPWNVTRYGQVIVRMHFPVRATEGFCVLSSLTIERVRWIDLPLEPALAKSVLVARVEAPALRQRAEGPGVARLLRVCGLCRVR